MSYPVIFHYLGKAYPLSAVKSAEMKEPQDGLISITFLDRSYLWVEKSADEEHFHTIKRIFGF